MSQENEISCQVDNQEASNICEFTIKIPSKITKSFFKHSKNAHQKSSETLGFKQGTTPLNYIEKHFKAPIITHLKEVALKFFSIDRLIKKIHEQKIILVGPPKLTSIEFDSEENTIYKFQGHTPKEVYMQSWKYLPFKPVIRKKYRDIDKQSKNFLNNEAEKEKNYDKEKGIQINDWVYFTVWLVNQKNSRIFETQSSNLWLKIGNEEPDLQFQNLFCGKKIGDNFITDISCLQSYFFESSDTDYLYEIIVKDIVPKAYFSIKGFRNFFKIKTNKDLHNKIAEVFSFHNDISQHRSMSFEALNLIRTRNQISLPEKAIELQKKFLITEMQFRPDFMVYKMNPNFEENIKNFAKKQLADNVITEFIAYQDNLKISHDDIKAVLNLTQRPRIKDFIYFPFIESQSKGQEIPIDQKSLEHFCMKEKTVNHIIYHLTKK